MGPTGAGTRHDCLAACPDEAALAQRPAGGAWIPEKRPGLPALPARRVDARPKRLRDAGFAVPAEIHTHACQWRARLGASSLTVAELIEARQRVRDPHAAVGLRQAARPERVALQSHVDHPWILRARSELAVSAHVPPHRPIHLSPSWSLARFFGNSQTP